MSFGGASSGGIGGGSRRTMTRIPYYVYYNPLTNVPNCTLWLDSSDINGNGTNVSVGSSVATWIDKSGSGNNFVQTTASNKPVYQNDTLFNKNGLSFNGASRYMVQSNTSLYAINSNDYTIFTVHSFYDPSNGPGQNDGTIYRAANVAAAVWFRQQGPNAANFYTDTNYISVYGSPTALSGSSLSGISCVNTSAGSTAEGFINGVSAGTANRGGTTNLTLMLGTSPTLSNEYFYGTLFEMMVFNRGLSSNEQQTIESYLSQKYKITTVLPTTHLNVTRPAGTPRFVSAIVVNTLPVAYTVPNAVDSNAISISLTSNLFLVSWPAVGQQGSLRTYYKVDMFRNTVLSTSGGTLLNSQTVSSSIAALAGTYNLSNYYYAGIYSSNTKGLSSVVYSPFDQPPPPPPASLGISITPTLASFTISASSNATYDTLTLYSNPTNSTTGGTLIESTTGSNLTPVIAGTFSRSLYYYATATAGNPYGESDPFTSASTQIPPLAPASLGLSMTTSLASYTIAAVSGASTYSVSIYSNSSNATTGGSLVNTVSGAAISQTSSGSYSAALYYYAVAYAINLGGNSSNVTSSAVSPVPNAPATLTFSMTPTDATFTIASITGATSYNVVLYSNAANSTSGGTSIGTYTGASTTPTITGSYVNSLYYYATVSATAIGGTSGLTTSSVMGVTPVAPATATVSFSSGTVSSSWSSSSQALNYTVSLYYNTTNSTSGATLSSSVTTASTSNNFTSLVSGYYYYITVVAKNGSYISSATTSSILGTVPLAPTSLTWSILSATGSASWTGAAGALSYNLALYSNSTSNNAGGTLISTSNYSGTTATYSSMSTTAFYYYVLTSSNATGLSASNATSSGVRNLTIAAFSYTGGNQTWTSPAGLTSINIYMWGGGGGGGFEGTSACYGGAGAYLQGTLTVTASTAYTIIVGGGGGYNDFTATYGGGGWGGWNSGDGGGRSAIIRSGTELVTVAGGGGASYWAYDAMGGCGDSVTGTGESGGIPASVGGTGGTQSSGGVHAVNGGSNGGLHYGGNATPGYDGGGGGSGYYGGGAGGFYEYHSGGGGGSSYTNNVASLVASNSPDRHSAPGSSSPYYSSGVAVGAYNAQRGGDGRVVITY